MKKQLAFIIFISVFAPLSVFITFLTGGPNSVDLGGNGADHSVVNISSSLSVATGGALSNNSPLPILSCISSSLLLHLLINPKAHLLYLWGQIFQICLQAFQKNPGNLNSFNNIFILNRGNIHFRRLCLDF